MFCRFPLGLGSALPNKSTNDGVFIAWRRRREERRRLFLVFLVGACLPNKDETPLYLMVCSSFFPGHQVPAAKRLPPGFTSLQGKFNTKMQPV